MANAHQKKYLKKLAIAIDQYWEGDEKSAIITIKQAEKDLEDSIGKQSAENFQNSLESWLKKWRETLVGLIPQVNRHNSAAIDCFQELRPPDDSFQTSESDIIFPDELLPEDELSIVFTLYKEDKIVEAVELLNSLREKYQSTFEENPIVTEIECDYADIRQVYRNVREKIGWNNVSTGDISVFYKNIPGTESYSLMTEGVIETPLFHFLSIIYETDLHHTWLPFCTKSFTIANLSRTRKIIFQEFNMPFLAVRHACLYGYGANMLQTDGAVVIISKSCDREETFKGVKLPENLKSKRAIVHIMGTIIRPLSLNKIHVTIITNFDPVVKSISYKILNYFSKKLAKGIFKKMAKLAQNFEGSIYEERMSNPENKEFYDYIHQSHLEYLNTIGCK